MMENACAITCAPIFTNLCAEAKARLEAEAGSVPEVRALLEFLASSTRGILR